MSLLLFSALAHLLPSRAFASAAIAQGVLVVAQALGDLGLSQATVSALPAAIAARPMATKQLMRGAAQGFIGAAAVALAVALLLSFAVPEKAQGAVILIAPAAAIAVFVSGADGLLRARGDFQKPAIIVSINRVGSLVGVPAAALTGSANVACLAISIGTVLTSWPAARVLIRHIRGAARGEIRSTLTAAAPTGLAQLLVLATGRLNTVFLSSFAGLYVGAIFESSWRVYQLAQYFVGGLATGASPFIADALGSGKSADVRHLLRRTAAITFAGGLILGAGMFLLRQPLSSLLFGTLGTQVSGTILPFAILTPLSFMGFLAMVTLAASVRDRWWILIANGLGAVVNITLALLLVPHHGAARGTLACAVGLAVAQFVLLLRLASMLRRDRSSSV